MSVRDLTVNQKGEGVAANWKLGGTLAYTWGENRDAGTALPQMPPLEARVSARFDNAR